MNFRKIFLAAMFPALALSAKELLPDGNFESGKLPPKMHVKHSVYKENKLTPAPKDTVTETIVEEKVFEGKKSLLIVGKEEGFVSLFVNFIKAEPNKTYEYSCRCFIEEANPKFAVSGRVILGIEGSKERFFFSDPVKQTGKWMQFKQVFKTPANVKTISITVWVGRGPFKVYLDDIRVTELEAPAEAAK